MKESTTGNLLSQACPESEPATRRGLWKNQRGAVFIEFLIAFLPVQVFFLCLIQSAILYSVRLFTEHAAISGARAAAVVIGDVRGPYNEDPHVLSQNGERRRVVRRAVLLSLAPLIFTGLVQSVDVLYPRPDQPDGQPQTGTIRFQPLERKAVQKVRLRVEVDAACRIGFASRIVCPGWINYVPTGAAGVSLMLPTRKVRSEAIYPYQGAAYDY